MFGNQGSIFRWAKNLHLDNLPSNDFSTMGCMPPTHARKKNPVAIRRGRKKGIREALTSRQSGNGVIAG